MSYERVIPRDFFNEAKLLKCMGVLALKILDGMTPVHIHIHEPGTPFEIIQEESDGSLLISNYEVKIKGRYYCFSSPYNSKNNFPLTVTTYDQEDIKVFTEEGEFSKEFIEFCHTI